MTFTLPPPPLPPSLHFRDAMHDGHCHSASRVTSRSHSLSSFAWGRISMPRSFWQIYIQHLHPSLKSINYRPLTGRKTPSVIRKTRKEKEEQKILLLREQGDRVESANMQRDETMCVLDVGMKEGGEESKAAARCGVRGRGAGSSRL